MTRGQEKSVNTKVPSSMHARGMPINMEKYKKRSCCQAYCNNEMTNMVFPVSTRQQLKRYYLTNDFLCISADYPF
jgi:hypothetical protein